MKAKPKKYVMYTIKSFSGEAECYIHCHPQQTWEINKKDKNHTELSRKNLTIVIPTDDFEKQWKIIK